MRKYCILEQIVVKQNGEVRTLSRDEIIELEENAAERLLKAGVICVAGNSPIVDDMEAEYFRLLERFYEIDEDTNGTHEQLLEEARHLVVRLDELFQALNREGRMMPVRLP